MRETTGHTRDRSHELVRQRPPGRVGLESDHVMATTLERSGDSAAGQICVEEQPHRPAIVRRTRRAPELEPTYCRATDIANDADRALER